MNAYREEAEQFDRAILAHIATWHENGTEFSEDQFNDLALRIFAHQMRYNEPYARYCATLGFDAERLPNHWTAVPAVPSAAFKEAELTTFPAQRAALTFRTSGTTQQRRGAHYMEVASLYNAALLAGFDRAMRWDNAALRYFNLLPTPAEAPSSSLAYMMGKICDQRARGQSGWYLNKDLLLFDSLVHDLRDAVARQQAVCLAGTAFALVHFLDEFAGRDLRLHLPPGSRVMETGGFKGRARAVKRETFYERLSASLGIAPEYIVAEYGMTELTSQYYDSAPSRTSVLRVKVGPPWLRTVVARSDGRSCVPGERGALTHVDLANRSSVMAIATEDIGVATHDGFVLVGRDTDAELRGCSLNAEDLLHA